MPRKRRTCWSCRGVELRRQNIDVGWREGRSERLLLTPPLCPLGAANGDPRTSILACGLQNKAKGTRLVPVFDDEMAYPTRFERVASTFGGQRSSPDANHLTALPQAATWIAYPLPDGLWGKRHPLAIAPLALIQWETTEPIPPTAAGPKLASTEGEPLGCASPWRIADEIRPPRAYLSLTRHPYRG